MMSEAELEELLQEMAVNIWAVPRAMTRHLLSESEDEAAFQAHVRERMDPENAAKLVAARHRPQRALYQLTHSDISNSHRHSDDKHTSTSSRRDKKASSSSVDNSTSSHKNTR